MKKVLVIGGNGFVGGHMVMHARKLGYEPAIADTQDGPALPGIPYFKCDITDSAGVEALFRAYRPDFAVNVAAVADIDKAEQSRRLAEMVNVVGAANAAKAAADVGAKYCWFSSDAVFDGLGCGYNEQSELAPVNYYGKTKEMGEEAVFKANPASIVPRISLVLGFPLKQGNSFLAGLYGKLKAGQVVQATTEEVRTPIDVLTLCEAIFELFEQGFSGVVHLGSTGSISRYELTGMLARKLGASPGLVEPAGTAAAARAPRHKNGIIDVGLASRILRKTKLLTVEQTVERALTTIQKGENDS